MNKNEDINLQETYYCDLNNPIVKSISLNIPGLNSYRLLDICSKERVTDIAAAAVIES